jgi:tetratricopeptide (TPR) repeat protein
LVRAAAAQGLSGHLTPETLPALLEALADDFRLVRIRAAAALAPLPPDRVQGPQRQSLEHATEEFIAAMHARPDDHASYHSLGLFYAERGELKRALAAYETASRLEPRAIQPLVNASLVHNQLGQNDKAEQCLRKALEIDPTSLAANLNLGMLLGELGRPREAEEAFRAALAADPESAQAAYNLAVLVAERDMHETIELCRTASRLRPEEPKYAFALAFYLHRAGDDDQAIEKLHDMLTNHPGFADSYSLLGSLLTQHGRAAEAIKVFRRAADNASLPPAVRRHFAAQARELEPR